jgi:hypothetical protein
MELKKGRFFQAIANSSSGSDSHDRQWAENSWIRIPFVATGVGQGASGTHRQRFLQCTVAEICEAVIRRDGGELNPRCENLKCSGRIFD